MRLAPILILLLAALPAIAEAPKPSYNDSTVIAPLYIEYAKVSDDKFASEARELRQRLGEAPHVLLGFAAFLSFNYEGELKLDRPIEESMLEPTRREADLLVNRAATNGLVTHIALVSGFFHGWNRLREIAIQQDVRNAQWFADGWIGPPEDLKDPVVIPHSIWVTPSRYATDLHSRMEESVRIIARHLADTMAAAPGTLVSISGDGEVELTWERNLGDGAVGRKTTELLYTDYSPFAVAEFRDWLRFSKYLGDRTPDSDDDGDGHTFNGDYQRHFSTWELEYFNDSGPIPFASYVALRAKLPASGPYFKDGGFDAPRSPNPGDPLWNAWLAFRRRMIGNYVHDFAQWITTTPSGKTNGFSIPADRFYSHQIPAEFLFEQADNVRVYTSASSLDTAFAAPFGSPGVTAYNVFDGKRHLRTVTKPLLSQLRERSANWAVLEYNPSAPLLPSVQPSNDLSYYSEQLRLLYDFRPHVIVPFPWTELPEHSQAAIKDKPFERALQRFIKDIGNTPWSPGGNSRR